LNILNEIIAHCTNTKKENGEIDFEKIFDTMKDNENYFKISEIKDINEYYKTLDILIKRTEIELNNNNLDSVMIKLIEEYSKEN
jgi:alcohol dehydrogenase YqhD (iron-dependent ADH family)